LIQIFFQGHLKRLSNKNKKKAGVHEMTLIGKQKNNQK